MLTEIAWLMTKAYIILIFTAAVIRSEQILYDASTYIFRDDKKNGMYGCIEQFPLRLEIPVQGRTGYPGGLGHVEERDFREAHVGEEPHRARDYDLPPFAVVDCHIAADYIIGRKPLVTPTLSSRGAWTICRTPRGLSRAPR